MNKRPLSALGSRSRRLVCLLLLFILLPAACRENPRRVVPLVVASADSVEQQILGALTLLYLEDLGYRVEDKTNLGGAWAMRSALKAGRVDLCWEYTGTTWQEYLVHDRPIPDAEELYRRVREEDAQQGIAWLTPTSVRHQLVLAVRREQATALGLRTISDLVRHVNQRESDMMLCTPRELYDTARGIRGLERVYGVQFRKSLVRFGSGQQGFEELKAGRCDCAFGYTTDAALVGDLYWLEDDRRFVQPSQLAIGVRLEVLAKLPELEGELERLAAALTQEELAAMQRQVLKEGAKPRAVAKRFLGEQKLGR